MDHQPLMLVIGLFCRSYQESPRAGLLPRLRQQLVLVAHCLQRLSFTSPGNKQLAAQVAGEVHALMQERLALHLGVPAQQQRQMRREPLPLLLQLLQLSGRIAGQHNDCSVLPGLVKVSVHSSWAYDVQQLQDSGGEQTGCSPAQWPAMLGHMSAPTHAVCERCRHHLAQQPAFVPHCHIQPFQTRPHCM